MNKIQMCGSVAWLYLLCAMFGNVKVKDLIYKSGKIQTSSLYGNVGVK